MPHLIDHAAEPVEAAQVVVGVIVELHRDVLVILGDDPPRAQVFVGGQHGRAVVVLARRQARHDVVDRAGGPVIVIDLAPVGVDQLAEPNVLGGHGRDADGARFVNVLDKRRAAVDRAVVLLILAGQQSPAIIRVFHLVDSRRPGRVGETGDRLDPAQVVIGRPEPFDRLVDKPREAETGYRVGGKPPNGVIAYLIYLS